MNIVAIFHSYKFTHFVDEKIELTKDPKKLSASEKISTEYLVLTIQDLIIINYRHQNLKL